MLLTRSPLYSPEGFRARLACLIHTANVRSEPGSNPSIIDLLDLLILERAKPGKWLRLPNARTSSRATLIVKERRDGSAPPERSVPRARLSASRRSERRSLPDVGEG